MNGSDRPRLIRHSIVIAVGTLFFVLFVLVCYLRELGPAKPPTGLFGFVIGLGAVAALAGAVALGTRPAEERGFGITLAVEGLLLIALTLVALQFMGPVPLPP